MLIANIALFCWRLNIYKYTYFIYTIYTIIYTNYYNQS